MPYKDPIKERKWARNKRAKNTLLVQELKNNPCSDCGEIYPHYCMEWDHLDGTIKKSTVAKLAHKGLNSKVFVDELAKCELVCANCHKIRTYERRKKEKPVDTFV